MVSTERHLVPKLTRGSLLERLRERCDHASWEEFFDQYWQLIYHVARRAGLSEADAEDCVQETVVEVVDSLPGFERERPGSFRAWLCKVTRTQVAMFSQGRMPAQARGGGGGDVAASGERLGHRLGRHLG